VSRAPHGHRDSSGNALKAPSCAGIADAFTRDLCTSSRRSEHHRVDQGLPAADRIAAPAHRDDVDVDGNPVVTPQQIETHLRLNDLGNAVLDRDLSGGAR
jgi:hypothetical protein